MTKNENDFEIFSLAQFFADEILSAHNQFVSVRFVGKAGKGKSWAAISLCLAVAKIVGEARKEDPHKFFAFDEQHMAVMSVDATKTVMNNPVKNSILLLDDIGTVLNARKFMSEDNIDFNDVFQTFRPQNNLVVMTVQTGGLVDKVARILCHYEVEMEQRLFDQGLSIAKVQEIVLKHKTGEVYYPYICDKHGNKIVRVIFERPPEEITNEYERVRAIMLEKLQEEKERKKSEEVVYNKKVTSDQLFEPDIIKVFESELEKGIDKINFSKIAQIVSKENRFKKECSRHTVKQVLEKYNLLGQLKSYC